MKDFKTVMIEHYTPSLEPFWAGRKCRGNSDAQEVGPKDLAGPPRSLHIVSNPAIQEGIPKAEMTAREPPHYQEVALLNLNLAEDKMTIIMVAQAEESALITHPSSPLPPFKSSGFCTAREGFN